jgi:hypothetical protein
MESHPVIPGDDGRPERGWPVVATVLFVLALAAWLIAWPHLPEGFPLWIWPLVLVPYIVIVVLILRLLERLWRRP